MEKIIVHAASDPKGKNRTQEINIYYKGIGALEMSKVTASMDEGDIDNAEAIPFSLSSRCFLIGSSLPATVFLSKNECIFLLQFVFNCCILSTVNSE